MITSYRLSDSGLTELVAGIEAFCVPAFVARVRAELLFWGAGACPRSSLFGALVADVEAGFSVMGVGIACLPGALVRNGAPAELFFGDGDFC